MARIPTKQLIIEAAVKVAAKHGISGASMDEIAEVAGVAKGSLYYNFRSKDTLFEAVIQQGFERLTHTIEHAVSTAAPAEAPRVVAAATLESLRSNVDLARIMASEVFRTDRAWFSELDTVRHRLIGQYRDALRVAQRDAGSSDDEVAQITETAGAAFFGAIAGACLDWLLFRKEQPVERVLDQIMRVHA